VGAQLAAEGRYTDAVAPLRGSWSWRPRISTARDNLRIMEQLAARQQAALPGAGAAAAPGRP
jgi:hypothetical protein